MLPPDGKADGISLEASLNFSFVRGGATFATPGMALAWCLHKTDTHCFLLPVCSLEQHHSFILHLSGFSRETEPYVYVYIYIYICVSFSVCGYLSLSFFLSFLSSYLKIFILKKLAHSIILGAAESEG